MFSEKVVVLWSGGIDSTGLIQILLSQHQCEVFPIFVRRGQSNVEFEQKAINYYSDIFGQKEKFHGPFIVESKIPALKFKEYDSDDKYFLRNSDLINNAVRYATLEEIDTVLISTFGTDRIDGRKEYLDLKEREVICAIEKPEFKIFSPFQNNEFNFKSKKEIFEFCSSTKLDLSLTRSCYSKNEKNCLVCDACNQLRAIGLIK